MTKVTIYFEEHEHTALHQLAEREYRTIPAQAALMIRRQLQSLGLLPVDESIPNLKPEMEISQAADA